MSATETATERAAIEQIVQLYIDGVSKGDGEKLRQAFHESAWMYGSLAGTRYDEPISELITLVIGQPLDSDGSYDARIVSVAQVAGCCDRGGGGGRLLGWDLVHELLRPCEDRRPLADRQQDVRTHGWRAADSLRSGRRGKSGRRDGGMRERAYV